MTRFGIALATAAIVALTFGTRAITVQSAAGSSLTPVPCPSQEWQVGDAAFEPLAGAKAFSGTYDGGIYRMEIPEKWNGELMLSAHGYVPNSGQNGSTLRVGNPLIRQHLVDQGFAWAASSYRCNGYVPGQGLLDTIALTDLFTKFNGGTAPRRVYLTGTSMGGHVTLLGMQEFPSMFAGGLAMCPASPDLFDYFTAVGAAAEVITGVQFKPHEIEDDVKRMSDAVGKPPDYTEKGRQLASVEILMSGGPRPFALEGLASRFVANATTEAAVLAGSSTTPSARAMTNADATYAIDRALGLSADDLNARARRKAADPQVRSLNGPYRELAPLTGAIERPLLTMHGTGDLYVPVVIEQRLKRAVEAAGKQQLLAQRLYRIAGHCGFNAAEQGRAFDDLVKWVRDGVRPDGDDVAGNLTDAGRKFTNPLRPGDPGGTRVTPLTEGKR
jgi:dienelactone hydrolase